MWSWSHAVWIFLDKVPYCEDHAVLLVPAVVVKQQHMNKIIMTNNIDPYDCSPRLDYRSRCTSSIHKPRHGKLSWFWTEWIYYGNKVNSALSSQGGATIPHSVTYPHILYWVKYVGFFSILINTKLIKSRLFFLQAWAQKLIHNFQIVVWWLSELHQQTYQLFWECLPLVIFRALDMVLHTFHNLLFSYSFIL